MKFSIRYRGLSSAGQKFQWLDDELFLCSRVLSKEIKAYAGAFPVSGALVDNWRNSL
jgi:hypothetical protein